MSYGRFFARPAWGIQRTMVLGSVAYFVGALIGQLQRASAHFRFTQSLENPRGFAQALQNVNIRLGADKPLPWTLPQVGEILPSTIGSPDVHGDTARPDEGQSNTWAPEATYTMPASPGTTESPPPSSRTFPLHSLGLCVLTCRADGMMGDVLPSVLLAQPRHLQDPLPKLPVDGTKFAPPTRQPDHPAGMLSASVMSGRRRRTKLRDPRDWRPTLKTRQSVTALRNRPASTPCSRQSAKSPAGELEQSQTELTHFSRVCTAAYP